MTADSKPLHQNETALIEVLLREFGGDKRAQELFQKFLKSAAYSRQFTVLLLDVARGNQGDSWEVRRLATLMLQEHLLALDANDTSEFDFVFRQLGLKNKRDDHGEVIEDVLKEGYSTRHCPEFILEFRNRLLRPRIAIRPRRKKHVTIDDVRKFVRQSRQDCKLTLARYLFSAAEVVRRIHELVQVRTGSPLEVEDQFAQEEILVAIRDLPVYEAAILTNLIPDHAVLWVADQTPAELNSLVEYPIGTVVLVVKPPGSHYEFEFKRAGRRGNHPLSARSHVPPSHRLDGGSMASALQHDASNVAIFSRVYRRVHDRPAPLSRIVNLTAKFSLPLRDGDRNILDYFNDPAIFGEGYNKMRQAMTIVVECFRNEMGDLNVSLPGDVGLTVQFMAFAGPAQAAISGSSSFRLDLVANYLGPEGPVEYFTRGLKCDFRKKDARLLADDVLDEVLGIYVPPKVKYEKHHKYVDAALAVPKNRSRANAVYLDLHEQIGKMWGTLLGIRGYSHGESFVARNVGIRTVWSGGKWRVQIVFQDHDNLVVPDSSQKHFWPLSVLPPTSMDGCYIGTAPDDQRMALELNCLKQIYRADESLQKKGRKQLKRAIKQSYVETQKAMKCDPKVQSHFNKRFVNRLRDWDAVARKYISRNGSSNGEWKARVRKYLKKRGYSDLLIGHHCDALDRHGSLVDELSYLYRAKIENCD